ncbi:sigma-54-dependent transcriptional regulator [Lewinella sp. LCG006]|uniref:sigma-54-dependent transcriptional regulator n=1 Tax=Lewinella sp. LCG006 TaxID=3231911 RepID=UPI00345FB3B3
MEPLILIIDDDEAVCAALRVVMRRAGFRAESVQLFRKASQRVAELQPDVVLLDMNFTVDTSGRQGLSLLKELLATDPRLPVILLTGWATVQLAVEGMKLGARDFMAKPWDNKDLIRSIRDILAQAPSRAGEDKLLDFDHIIGKDPALMEVLDTARQIAPTNASVLITGESGTGKELIAEAIHAGSKRAEAAFVKVNLGGIPASLFESEMFGHIKGAFTDARSDRQGRFAIANGGTIFLDEIGDLPAANQVKLLRVLQEQTFEVLGSSQQQRVDVRVISATNKQLDNLVQQGSFREDLLYRINLITLHLPPLRQRPGDIPLLVEHFLQRLEQTYERSGLELAPSAREWLKRQAFPGNIRQLKNVVERTVLLAKTSLLTAEDFARHLSSSNALTGEVAFLTGEISLEEMELAAIKRALSIHENNITAAAKSLGITRSALYRRLQKFGIDHAT